MEIRKALQAGFKVLKMANIATYQIDTLLILKTVLNRDDVYILTHQEEKLSKDQTKLFLKLLKKRKNYYPMAYITHTKEFYGFEFHVDERVLIPRPETEMLVEETIRIAKTMDNPVIVDVATGSGCIAITLSKLLNRRIIATDISKDAIDVAKLNAKRLNADVEFIIADKLSFLKRADIIVCNPPYIPQNEYGKLQPDVKFEPKIALIDKTGTDFLQRIHKEAEGRTQYLLCEIGYNQLNSLTALSGFRHYLKDLNNIPRVVVFKF